MILIPVIFRVNLGEHCNQAKQTAGLDVVSRRKLKVAI